MKVLELIKSAKINPEHHRSIMEQNTVDYLVSKFPRKADMSMKKDVSAIKKKIKETEKEIKALEKKLAFLERGLKNTCSHPASHLVHGGYACSGAGESGKFNHPIKEDVYCKLCGYQHYFECQEASEDYLDEI